MKLSSEILLKVGVPLVGLLFACNIYFVKNLVDQVNQIPVLSERIGFIQTQMPNISQMRTEVEVLKNKVTELREDIKRGRL
jgi:hypothetical protein